MSWEMFFNKTYQESNVKDPFQLYADNVTIIFRRIWDNSHLIKDAATGEVTSVDYAKRKSIGIIGFVFDIDYLRKLINSSLEKNIRYLVFDHHRGRGTAILNYKLAMHDLYESIGNINEHLLISETSSHKKFFNDDEVQRGNWTSFTTAFSELDSFKYWNLQDPNNASGSVTYMCKMQFLYPGAIGHEQN